MSGDVPAAPPSALEVVSFVGRTVGAGAALTAAVYLLRKVCLIMAWKSGGASHAELVNNLRSESACFYFHLVAKSDRTGAFYAEARGMTVEFCGARSRRASWLLSYVVCCRYLSPPLRHTTFTPWSWCMAPPLLNNSQIATHVYLRSVM